MLSQRIRSKAKVPVLVGPPPPMPVPKPIEMTNAWKTLPRKFAYYYLILFRPWTKRTTDGSTLPESAAWYDFCIFMKKLDCGDESKTPSHQDIVRSKWIHNTAHGLRIAGKDRTAASKYRNQSAKRWSDKDDGETLGRSEPQETAALLSNNKMIQEEMAAIEAQQNIDLLRDRTAADDLLQRSNHNTIDYYQATQFALQRIFSTAETDRERPHQRNELSQIRTIICHPSIAINMAAILQELKTDVLHPPCEDDNEDTIIKAPIAKSIPVTNEPRLSDRLNTSQRKIWQTTTNYFQKLSAFRQGRGARPDPLRLLIHGGPGTDKLFLAECIRQSAEDFNLTIGCQA